jgi:hypothetical protein
VISTKSELSPFLESTENPAQRNQIDLVKVDHLESRRNLGDEFGSDTNAGQFLLSSNKILPFKKKWVVLMQVFLKKFHSKYPSSLLVTWCTFCLYLREDQK